MSALFKKLNYKDQPVIYVLNAPASFNAEIEDMAAVTSVKTTLKAAKRIVFVLAFVTKQNDVDTLAAQLIPIIEGDAVVWFAYPKGTSKKYKCEFNRDNGWKLLGENGYEGVRMVAIDEDWSALRFRKAEHIKTMTRSFAMSEAGKIKASKKK